MRQHKLTDGRLPSDLATLSGVQMNRAWSIGWERTIQNSKIDISA
jgi:hypothetical protein